MGYQLRDEQMTREEIKAKSAENYIEEVIAVDLDDIIGGDFEQFLNGMEYQLLGDQGIVTDMEYTVVGTGMNDMLHIKVSGFVELAGEDY
jgi:hypothetical protein